MKQGRKEQYVKSTKQRVASLENKQGCQIHSQTDQKEMWENTQINDIRDEKNGCYNRFQ